MVETYPSQVKTFTVVGRLVKGIVDSADLGPAPDVVPISGATITFTPSLTPPIFRIPTASTPLTVFQETIVATTDSNGYLKAPGEMDLGVVLAWGSSPSIVPTGWTWNVSIAVGGNFPPLAFAIAGSDGGVIDLSTVIPVSANPGVDLAQWISVTNTVEAARDAAIDAAISSENVLTTISGMAEGLIVVEDPARPGFARVNQDFGDFVISQDPLYPGFASVTVN